MTSSSRRLATALLGLCAAVATGCSAPGGLGAASPAPPVSMQPRPEPLWPAWTEAPGAKVGRREPAPVPLKAAPALGAKGLLGVMRPHLGKAEPLRKPGRAGIRPPVFKDLPTGRSALSVCAVSGGRIVSSCRTRSPRAPVRRWCCPRREPPAGRPVTRTGWGCTNGLAALLTCTNAWRRGELDGI
ncbi:hypothetical protein ACFCV9_31525 [Streptomyces sp. NPDC056367]|uniref:hypothetical protein n=1 Tax=Streptomyces sp. NPDC056367 TaxID=3345797 RepID=UPI0035DA3ED1